MDQDETWQRGRPPPRPPCVRWGPSSSLKGHSPQFSAHVCCGQTAGWIMMPLRTKVGLGPGHIVGTTQLLLKRGTAPNFRPMSIVAKRSPISATAEHLLHTYRLQAHHHRHRHIFSGNYMRTKSEVVNNKRVQWTGQQGSPVTDGTDKIKIYKRPSSDVKNHEIFSGWKIQWKFHDFFLHQ